MNRLVKDRRNRHASSPVCKTHKTHTHTYKHTHKINETSIEPNAHLVTCSRYVGLKSGCVYISVCVCVYLCVCVCVWVGGVGVPWSEGLGVWGSEVQLTIGGHNVVSIHVVHDISGVLQEHRGLFWKTQVST